MRGLLAEIISKEADITIVDMEAGLEHLSRSGGTLKHVDHLMIVVEAYVKSIQTAYRTIALAKDLGIPRVSLLGSKVRDEGELAAIQRISDETGFEIIGAIPYDEAVRLADRDGRPPIDVAPDSAMVRAVRELARAVLEASASSKAPTGAWTPQEAHE